MFLFVLLSHFRSRKIRAGTFFMYHTIRQYSTSPFQKEPKGGPNKVYSFLTGKLAIVEGPGKC